MGLKRSLAKILFKISNKCHNELLKSDKRLNVIDKKAVVNFPCCLFNTKVGKGTYIAKNSEINNTTIGRFCSIGPNLVCGWGLHPVDTVSSSPCFYSTLKQNGFTFVEKTTYEETKPVEIGNDVFIGMNVTILDGVKIGDGAVIGAGAVVVKDVEPYAIVGGVSAELIRYRFKKEIIEKLLKIKWWNWDDEKLKEIPNTFYDVEKFVEKYFPKES